MIVARHAPLRIEMGQVGKKHFDEIAGVAIERHCGNGELGKGVRIDSR
jgi:hypothetical protein